MRINIYAEELTSQIEIVRKPVNQDLFRGVRLYLASPEILHHSIDDNDQSAVTVWVPWTRKKGHEYNTVINLLRDMANLLEKERDGER